ncbi:Fic/DOC family N-terminal domain-containing protein [Amycolatopsis sp. A133]|uniref:Fic family protein n=1 Tax=Amycolatopsis sp. A133 TaxID=3064472 RepID=UPI0027E6F9CE|nr:Fic/DOC family N-terminal domain-containing protein [Amycolatopsis sp. A133]MDQ7804713.1 Fic/DOC family N-terminal domain-containing protein [Amycolatopsis sp. A133]
MPVRGVDSRTKQAYDHFAFVPAPLPSVVELSPGTYKVLSEADRALGSLDALTDRLPNPDLLVRPSLTREAVSTSALEGTYAPYADVLEAHYVDSHQPTAEVREVQNYVQAAFAGLDLVKKLPICLQVVSKLQQILVAGTRGDAYDAGRLRERLVCIGDRGRGIEQSRFVPPPNGDSLRDGVSDWEKWINADQEMPVLVKVALGHYLFETLHPFSDGNGRIGRLVITLQLIEEAFSQEVIETMKGAGARGTVHELAVNLIGYPMTTIPKVQADLGVSYPTAATAIRKLEEPAFSARSPEEATVAGTSAIECTTNSPKARRPRRQEAPPTRRMTLARIPDTTIQKMAAMP